VKTISLLLLNLATLLSARGQGTFLTTVAAYLNGSCEVPANNSTNIGAASFRYSPLGGTSVICSVNFDLPFIPVDASIHGPAYPGETAPLLFNIGSFSVVTNILEIISWPPATNYFTNVSVVCSNTVVFSQEQMSQFLAGLFYVNVTSTNFPAGEVRGQITDRPVLSVPGFAAGTFGFKIIGANSGYVIESSSNLTDWVALTNSTVTNTVVNFLDGTVSNCPLRFYRARR